MPGWRKWVLAVLGLLLLVVISAPWWLGAAARPLLAKYGATFGRYERTGYRTFVLHDIRYARGGTEVIVKEARGVTPLLWAFDHLRSSPSPIALSGWQVRVEKNSPTKDASAATSAIRGLPSLHQQLVRVAERLEKFLPAATAENGVIEVRGQRFLVPEASWRDGRLSLKNVEFRDVGATLDLSRTAGAFVLRADAPASESQAELRWTADTVEGKGTLWNQPWQVGATFPETGWMPSSAEVDAQNWDIPAERVRLQGYSRVHGNVTAKWDGAAFLAKLAAYATPRGEGKAPPLHAAAEAHGDREEINVTALRIESSFFEANLTGSVTLGYNGELRSDPAALLVSGDLADVPWFDAAGKYKGRVTFDGRGASSHGEFDLTFENVVLREVHGRAARLRGAWRIPQIDITEARVEIDDATTLRGTGSWNWRQGEIAAATISGRVAAKSVKHWLPGKLEWDEADIELRAKGPVAAPEHEGSVRAAGFRAGPLHPTSFNAQWRGRGTDVESVTLTANNGEARLSAAGSIHRAGIDLREFALARSDTQTLTLAAPAALAWSPALEVRGFRLEGGNRHLAADASLAPDGAVRASVSEIDDQWLRDWVSLPGPKWNVHRLQLDGRQAEKTFAFNLDADTTLVVRNEPVRVQLAGTGDANGVTITQSAVVRADQTLTRASGKLPLTFTLSPQPAVAVQYDGALALKADVTAESALWPLLSELAGVKIENAVATADIGGTLNQPTGIVQVRVGGLKASGKATQGKLPQVSNLEIKARAGTGALVLDTFSAELAGQPVRATAELPLPSGTWQELRNNPRTFDWRRLKATIRTENVELVELARTMPVIPVTKGRLNASASLNDGVLTGELQFFNASSRPIPGMGVLQNIHANVRLDGETFTIESFRGELGSEPIDLSGTVMLEEPTKPRLDLAMKARNVPLVRRPGLLVRTDLDLRAETDRRGVTSITGKVELRDTLVLADLAAILPGGPRGVGRQPPYFAVEMAPFNEWPLKVDVRGARAVRVRTAVFNGVASANFDLTGTLGEPRAIGQLSVDEGRVLFPFATFDVQSGAVRISAANPHQLQLNVNAMARRHGYELKLDAAGTLANPVITLSSNPPLEAAEVLLMVTTGQPPADDTTSITSQQRLTQLGAYVGKGLLQNFGVAGGETRLEISSGEDVSRQGRETYQLEYRLNDKWALTGEYDEFDEYNAGVKWRVYEQNGKSDEKKK